MISYNKHGHQTSCDDKVPGWRPSTIILNRYRVIFETHRQKCSCRMFSSSTLQPSGFEFGGGCLRLLRTKPAPDRCHKSHSQLHPLTQSCVTQSPTLVFFWPLTRSKIYCLVWPIFEWLHMPKLSCRYNPGPQRDLKIRSLRTIREVI